MASTYSTNLGIELIGTGDQSGTWGATTNTNLGTLLEQAIVGYATQAVTDSASPTVLAITNGASSTGRNYVITLTGALTANRTVEVPAVNKPYTFFNNTTGGYAVTVKVSGQTGVTIANGKKAIVYTNSTDVIEVANAPVTEAGTQTLTNKTLTDPLISTIAGGTTASSTLTLESTTGAGTSDSILFKTGSQSTRMTIDTSGNVSVASGNLTFAGTGQRITGDMSNATIANRLLFQTSTTNGNTGIVAIPNGTASGAAWRIYNNSDTLNASICDISIDNSNFLIRSYNVGTGAYLPMTFSTGGSERMRLDTSGNVGIGTSSPATKLQLESNTTAQIRTGYVTSGATAYYDFGRDSADGYFGFNGAQSSPFVGYKWQINGTERMRIDSSGNVGIGTSSPSGCLDVQGSGSSAQRNWAYIRGGNVGAQNPVAGFSAGMAFGTNFSNGNSETNLVWGQAIGSGQYLSISKWTGTTVTEQMRIDSSGNVGIGTSSPSSFGKLAVFGGTTANSPILAIVSNAFNSQQGCSLDFVRDGFTQPIQARVSTQDNGVSASNLLFSTKVDGTAGALTERMRIDSSGNVGIGTTNPAGYAAKFATVAASDYSTAATFISSASAVNWARTDWDNQNVAYNGIIYQDQSGLFNIRNDGANAIAFSTNGGNERMRIDSSGNVGIGNTPSGTYKLEVTGTGAFTSSGATGTLVLSDTSSGNGCNIKITGNGATTPSKYLRVVNGDFNIVNNAYSAGIFTLTDAGNVTAGGSISDSKGNVRQLPINSQTSAYVLVAADAGKTISITTGGVTVNSGIFSAGDNITIYNNSGSNQTITQGGSVTVRQAGTANTGNRTLAQYGVCTLLCVASNTFTISGAGLS